MDQQLSNINLKAYNAINTDNVDINYDTITSRNGNENMHLLSSIKSSEDMTMNSIGFDQIASSHVELMKLFQRDLSLLTYKVDILQINSDINTILMTDIFPLIYVRCKDAIEEIIAIMKKQEQLMLNIFLKQNLEENENIDQSIPTDPFPETFSTDMDECNIDNTNESDDDKQEMDQAKFNVQKVSYFSIQSLTSLLMILIKSAEKNDPTFIQELLTLAIQLCDRIPINSFTSFKFSPIIDSYWFKSLQPLTNYINELSLSQNVMIANKAMKILLSISIAKASFKDILPILRKLIFNKVNIYNARNLFIRLNHTMAKALNKMEKIKQQKNNDSNNKFEEVINDNVTSIESIDYLKVIGAFPNSRLIRLNEKEFTGPFVASIILAHIDFYNEIHSIEQFKQGSIDSSISFEFHLDTFEQLFHIIEQLITTKLTDSNIVIRHILTVCVRLFSTHLKFLCTAMSTIDKDLFSISDEWKKVIQPTSTKPNYHIDLSRFLNDNKFNLWFDLLLKLINNNNENLEQITICREATKAIIYIIDKKVSSFVEKLSFFHTTIIENKYSLLAEQIFPELKKSVILLNWIEILINDDNSYKSAKKTVASRILYSFIDIYFNSLHHINPKHKDQIKQILLKFQELLLIRLISPSRIETILNKDKTQDELHIFSISHNAISFVIDYFTYMLNICNDNDLLNSIFVSLCLMIKTENIFNFDIIQSIITALLPIVVKHLLKNIINYEYEKNNLYSICWLIGKMSNLMIIGTEQNSLELKYNNKLKSILFSGGCEQIIIENNKYLFDLYKSNLAVYSQFKSYNEMQQSSSSSDD
ncbi:unnamed protein product, partial [Rotaria sp. Silwood1]